MQYFGKQSTTLFFLLWAAFKKMFYEKITADSVAKDVNFLRNTFYPLVSKTEAEGGYDGGYVPHKYT